MACGGQGQAERVLVWTEALAEGAAALAGWLAEGE